MLETVRYYIAYLTLATIPFALAYWYAIHPFVGFWRQRGAWWAFAMAAGLLGLNVALAWRWHASLLAVNYPVALPHFAVAGGFYLAAIAIELRCRRHLKFRTLAGVPELMPDGHSGELLDQGIYGKIRHPRYVAVSLGMLAVAIFCNDRSLWVLTLLTFPALYGIVLLEELELRDRFGCAYVEYSRRVPRFVPKFG